MVVNEEAINKIHTFIDKMDYKNDDDVVGIMFYGSYLHGTNNSNSDIDLHIIYDDYNKKLVRGNDYIDGTRIEYFEKPLFDLYETMKRDYSEQNNASLSMFGNAMIIFQKSNLIKDLQDSIKSLFSNGLPPLLDDEAINKIAEVSNRMVRLEEASREDSFNNPYFNMLFNLTLEKIRVLYHRLNGISKLETSKAIRYYRDKRFLKEFYCMDKVPDEAFLDMYYGLLESNSLSSTERYLMLEKFYRYTINTSISKFRENDYRIAVSNSFDKDVNDLFFGDVDSIDNFERRIVPPDVIDKIDKFIEIMGYKDNPDFLGVIVYGSSLTKYYNDLSDIDLHVVFNWNSGVSIRGRKIIDGIPIEYFEKSIVDEYKMIDYEFLTQNNASYNIIGRGEIIYDCDNQLLGLKKYAIARFEENMPSLTESEVKEQLSIVNNRIEKLVDFSKKSNIGFYNLYYLLIDRLRKIYHRRYSYPELPTSKVYRIYNDFEYADSMCKTNPDDEFLRLYMNAILEQSDDMQLRLQHVYNLYNYTFNNVILGDCYRIDIESRNSGSELSSKIYSKKKELVM